jgi:glutamate synthase domain-containing protein 2
MALGADWCNAARGFMFAVGCIQSQSCHTDSCPTGVATQDQAPPEGLVVEDKLHRVANFHKATVHALAELTAGGRPRPSQRSSAGPHLPPAVAQRGHDLRRPLSGAG